MFILNEGLPFIISSDLAKQITVVLVSSKLDYCNSLFHNMPEKDIARLIYNVFRIALQEW